MPTQATALTSVKYRLDITGSTWDTQLAEFLQSAVKRLYPYVQREIAPVTVNVTVDNGETSVNLAAQSIDEVRLLEAYEGVIWREHDDFIHHGTYLYVQGLSSAATQLKLYGRGRFTLDASVTVSTVPEHLEQAVYWYAMSEFYDYLVGNKSKYSVYAQSTGARSVENMQELAEYYEQKANVYLNDRAQVHGAS